MKRIFAFVLSSVMALSVFVFTGAIGNPVLAADAGEVPSDKLYMWLDASENVTVNPSNQVTSWKDKISGLDFTPSSAGSKPTQNTDSERGYRYVYFDGSSENAAPLRNNSFDAERFNGKPSASVVTVTLPESNPNAYADRGVVVWTNETYDWAGMSIGAGNTLVRARFGGPAAATGFGTIGSTWNRTINRLTTTAVVNDSGSHLLYVDGVKTGETNTSKVTPMGGIGTQINIGNNTGNTDNFKGRVAEVLIYEKALTQEEISEIQAYVVNKYFGAAKEITSVEPITVSTAFGELPALPRTVEITYSDDSKGTAEVTWESIDVSECYTSKSFTVYGTVDGTSIPSEAAVNVEPTQSLNDGYGVVMKASHAPFEPVEFFARYTIGNYSDDEGTLSVYACVYDADGRLLSVKATPVNVEKGTYTTGTVSMALPSDVNAEEAVFKAFLWDSKTFVPVIPSETSVYAPILGDDDDDTHLTDGMFKESQEVGEEYILNLNVDRLMRPFYNKAGRSSEAKAAAYPDWESMAISGHSIGHYLTAAAMMYRQTGNEVLKERLDYAVSELANVQDAQGFVGGGFTREQMEAYFDNPDNYRVREPANMGAPGLSWAPWYNLHKTFQGLIDAYTLTGNQQALDTVIKFADWTKVQSDKITDAQFQNMLRAEYGGMNESLAELYLLAENAGYPNADDYLVLAERFCHDAFFDPLSNGIDNLNGLHANTQIPKIVGAARLYSVTGDEYYKRVSEFFWNTVVNNRSYVTGGNSISEYFRDNEDLSAQTTETCNTYNMMKLTEIIYGWDHDSKYADYYENALYNHILGSQDPETGGKAYFIPTVQGHFRYFSKTEGNFWCCMGSGLENPARYSRFIYAKDGRDLYVNLFIPSTFVWDETGLELVQENNYPVEDTTKLTITKGADNVNIKIRVPSWVVAPVVVTVNGTEVASQQAAGYITLPGDWEEGDVIEAKFPMDLRLYTAKYNPQSVAVLYGPVVLAGNHGRVSMDGIPANNVVTGDHSQWNNYTRITVPPLVSNSRDPKDWIRRVDDEQLIFETMPIGMPGNTVTTLMPFYDIHYDRYTLYWTLLTESEYDPGDGELTYEERLDAVSLDDILVGQNQPEVDHNMVVVGNSNNAYFDAADSWWRDLIGVGSISFDMKVRLDGANYLVQRYWGADGNYSAGGTNYTRSFNVYVDGTLLKTHTLTGGGANELIDVFDLIPASLTQGKNKVTVRFESTASDTVIGGLFRLRTATEIILK